ncbi:MAG: LacI family transcriptional regulator [Lactobacillaceae bacterium]|nr:LacI family transcriptional regulator [Lactobacillaceae bacterium]
MATIADVARRASVSKMTVSRVINHPEKVSAEVREVVEQIIKEINYKPNRAAKELVSDRTYGVQFLILDDIEKVEPNYAYLLLHLAEEFQNRGYTMEISYEHRKSSNAEAIIVTGWSEEQLPIFESMDVPVILYGLTPDDSNLPYIDVNNKLGLEMSTQYLLDLGYDDVVFVGIQNGRPFELEREKGYELVMKRSGLNATKYFAPNSSAATENIIKKLDFPENTGFVCATDRIALGVLRALGRKDSIPEKYGVVGFDGLFIDRITSPQLTTIRQPLEKISRMIADELVNLIEDKPCVSKVVAPDLIVRESTR